MLFYFCGAPKNGGHFELLIITEALKQKGINYEPVGDKIFDHNDIKSAKQLFDELELITEKIFVCKGHWGTTLQRNLLLSYHNIRIFHIWRDIRDVLVSHYYYQMNRFDKKYTSFADYYWTDGRSQLFRQMISRIVWLHIQDPRVYHASFSELKENFSESAQNLLSFADIDNVDIKDLENCLSLNKLRQNRKDTEGVLFRRGQVGEYKEVIKSERIYQDIDRIENMNLSQIKISAVLHDPKVVLKYYYAFPGRRLLLKGANLYRRVHPKKHQAKKAKTVIWWK